MRQGELEGGSGLCGNFDFGGKETWVLRNTRYGAFYNPQGVKMTCRCLSIDVSIFWRKLEFNLGLPDIKLLPDFEFPSGGVVV